MPRLFEYDPKAKFNRGRELGQVYLTGTDACFGWMKKGKVPVHKGIYTGRSDKYLTAVDFKVDAALWSDHIVSPVEGWEVHILATRSWFANMVLKGLAEWREGQEIEG